MIPELERLRETVETCHSCTLAETRTKVVFGVGVPTSGVLLVGEAPGANEDAQGEPFVGRAGILLDKMLLAAGFSREKNVYIANMVKCRPPQNRDPLPEELNACIGYLRSQTAIIKPKIIVCLGRVAAKAIIDPNFRVTKDHGKFIEKDGILYMGTYHPAALLRFSANKPDAFADLLALRDKLAEIVH